MRIRGTNNNDELVGTFEKDIIFGLAGEDSIYGDSAEWTNAAEEEELRLGDDVLNGGADNDLLVGDR